MATKKGTLKSLLTAPILHIKECFLYLFEQQGSFIEL